MSQALNMTERMSGRPFVKRFALCYRSVVCPVCLSVLSVTLVHCGQTVGRIKMKLDTQVGLDYGHIVLDGDWGPSSTPQRGTAPQFSTHICCGQTAGWIKMPLGTKVGLGPGHIVLHGDPALPLKRHSPPIFGPCLLWPNNRPSQLLLSSCQDFGTSLAIASWRDARIRR